MLCALLAQSCADYNDREESKSEYTDVPENVPESEPENEPENVPESEPEKDPTQLIVCGSNMVYVIDATGALASGDYAGNVLWSWDAVTIAPVLGLANSRCDHIDDCKPVDDASKFLITSSYGWCVLLDMNNREVLFYTTKVPNAHSAELLPDDRIVVACSSGSSDDYNTLQLYDIRKPNVMLAKYTLDKAHGVVWNSATERLYAVGGKQMQIYSLSDWSSDSPKLKLEKTVTLPQTNVHDLTLADYNTLVVAGKKAYLYDIEKEDFTEMKHFSSCTSLKSLNYDADSGEIWYTDATVPEGDYDWSTHTINYCTDYSSSDKGQTFTVNDLNVYKVRILK